ncbi:MAG: GMC oxidoreductase [Pseudomonadota bacterium]
MARKPRIPSVSHKDIEKRGYYDAIVVGAGASGGLAAALLTEAGLDVLVLGGGRNAPFWRRPVSGLMTGAVEQLANPAALKWIHPKLAWKGRQWLKAAGKLRQPIQSACYAWETQPNGFVDDFDHPYETPDDKPYRWVRTRQLGGRMIVPAHGKQYLRHGAADFTAEDGLSPRWPVTIDEMEPWYQLVERRLGLNGQKNGSPWVPDSYIANPLEPDAAQTRLMDKIRAEWPAMAPMLGRYAEPMESLKAARATGRLHCREAAMGCRVQTTPDGNVEGVEFHDQAAGRRLSAKAPIVFLCASTVESVRILLLSAEGGFLKHASSQEGALGRYLMDHVSVKAEGIMSDGGVPATDFNLGNCVYLPRFDRRSGSGDGNPRGYGMRVYQSPGPSGQSYFTAVCETELLPRADNFIALSDTVDAWGIPAVRITCSHGPLEKTSVEAQKRAIDDVAGLVDAEILAKDDTGSTPGGSIHEVGGARFGDDPKSSVLNPNNECWDAKGLYVTDGSAFPAVGLQNPTLTILALTARACSHALRAQGHGQLEVDTLSAAQAS